MVWGLVSLVEIGGEAAERVAQGLGGFAHHRRADHHPQCIEGHRRAVAVGIGDQGSLQDTVIVAGRDDTLSVAFADGGFVVQRILRLQQQEVVCIVAHSDGTAEGIDVLSRQVKVIGGIGIEQRLPGRYPPVGIALTMNIGPVF
jgi:hypothetical protein